MRKQTRRTHTVSLRILSMALLASLGLAAPAFAQTAEQQQAQRDAKDAAEDAEKAQADAQAAEEAARIAAQASAAKPASGEAAVNAAVAGQQADQAATSASVATGAAISADAAFDGSGKGELETKAASEVAEQAAGTAEAASAMASEAAAGAQAAAQGAVAAPSDPAPVPAPMPVPGAQAEPLVSVTSSPPDSVVGQYRIDMAALDANGNGSLSRGEVKSNASLVAEFHAVDSNRNGSLSGRAEGLDRLKHCIATKGAPHKRGFFWREEAALGVVCCTRLGMPPTWRAGLAPVLRRSGFSRELSGGSRARG